MHQKSTYIWELVDLRLFLIIQNIAAGTAVRFEPGDTKTVELVDIAGNRSVEGFL